MATVIEVDTTPEGDFSKASLVNGVAGEDSMPPNLERFIPGKCLPEVIDVYLHNNFLRQVFGPYVFSDPSTARSTVRHTIKFVRKYPKCTVGEDDVKSSNLNQVPDRPDSGSLNKLSTGQLDLRCSERLGVGNHSEVFLAPITFPSTTPESESTIHGVVAVKLPKSDDDARMLLHEAKIYNAFPRNLHEADTPVVPNFYGYYVPHTEVSDRVNNDNHDDSSDSDEKKWEREIMSERIVGPILLLEACGKPVYAHALSDSGRKAISRLLNRLHKANFVQGSTYERNVLVQPGPLNQPPANRSLKEPSYRIIDFGRGVAIGVNCKSYEDIDGEMEWEKGHARDHRLIP